MIQCLFFFANRIGPWVGTFCNFVYKNNNQDSLSPSLYVCVGFIRSLGESVLVFFVCVVRKAIGFSRWVPKWKWEKKKENNFRFFTVWKINIRKGENYFRNYIFFSSSSSSSSSFLSIVRVRLFIFSASRTHTEAHPTSESSFWATNIT